MAVAGVLALLLVLTASAHAQASDAVEELRELSAGAKDRVIRLNDASFSSLAQSPAEPREYAVLVFFDAAMLHDNAQLDLPGFRKALAQVAKAYYEGVAGKDVNPLFFADIEYRQSEATYRRESIQSLPHIRLFPPGTDSKGVSMDMGRFGKNFAGIVQFLTDAGIDTSDLKPPPPLSPLQMALLGVAVIVLSPVVALHVLTRKTVLHDPRLWCAFGLCVYMFSVSGGMFNIIRNMPWYVPSRDKPGTFTYFLKQQGNQFGVEGLAIGSFYTTVGLVLAFNVYLLPLTKSDTVKRVVGMLSVVACAFSVRKVVEFEVWKQGYWVHGFWPSSWR